MRARLRRVEARTAAAGGAGARKSGNLVASVPGVVWVSWAGPDADALTTDYVSDHAAQMLGYETDEWTGQPGFWLSIVHPDDRARVAREQSALFAERGRRHTGISLDGQEVGACCGARRIPS